MSESTPDKIRRAEELADCGDYRAAVDVLEEVIDAGEAPVSALAMYGDYLRLREESTYACAEDREASPAIQLAHAKALRGSRQREYLNRVLDSEPQEDEMRVQLQLLRFENALKAGEPIAAGDFAALWMYSSRNDATRRIRVPLLSIAARASRARSVPVLRKMTEDERLPVAVQEFLKHAVQQLNWKEQALRVPEESSGSHMVPEYDTKGNARMTRDPESDPLGAWKSIFTRKPSHKATER